MTVALGDFTDLNHFFILILNIFRGASSEVQRLPLDNHLQMFQGSRNFQKCLHQILIQISCFRFSDSIVFVILVPFFCSLQLSKIKLCALFQLEMAQNSIRRVGQSRPNYDRIVVAFIHKQQQERRIHLAVTTPQPTKKNSAHFFL